MTMAYDGDLKTLHAIEEELTRIVNSFHGDALPERSASVALLFRQGELLVEKAKLFLAHQDWARGQDSAAEATAVLQGLANAAGAEFRVRSVELSARAAACVGLAQAQREDWFAARHTLGSLLSEAEERKVKPVHEVIELQSLVAMEDAERRRRFEEIVAEQESSGVTLAPHWQAAEVTLSRLVQEIAERIGEAKSILAGVPHPDRFETWLLERLAYFLQARTQETDPTVNADEDHPFTHEATERGRQLQLQIWSSDEMYYARNFRSEGDRSSSDEDLKSSREHGLLGLPHPDDPSRFAYPKWQFHEQKGSVQMALSLLHEVPEWARWNFFHTGHQVLRAMTPLQALGIGITGTAAGTEDERVAMLVREYGSAKAALLAATKAYLSGED